MNTTSISLLQQLREPNQDSAWERFVSLYAPMIYHWGLRHGLDSDDASDIVQEVMAELVERLPQFEYDSGRRFRGWLWTVTTNKIRDANRRRYKRRELADSQVLQAEATEVMPPEETELQGMLIRRALCLMQSDFHETTWRACWMHVAEGRRAADVGRELGITANAVHIAKCRVIGRLRVQLKGLID